MSSFKLGRERILLSGEAGVGKTKALFSIIKDILAQGGKTIYYMDCDGGAVRFLKDLEVVAPLLDNSLIEGYPRFYYYLTPDWSSARDAYRDIRKRWKANDWLMVDRVDLLWEAVQTYFNAAVQQVSEEDLDQLVLDRRAAARATAEEKIASGNEREAADAKKVKNTPIVASLMAQPDWGPIKSAYYSIVVDAYDGRDTAMKQINVAMTTLAKPREAVYDPSGSAGRGDQRVLSSYGMVVRGETNLPSQPDTHMLLRFEDVGYTMNTVKDRERKYVRQVVLKEEVGFLDTYQDAVGVTIL